MDTEYSKAAEHNSHELAQRIEQAIPEARIRDLGWLVFVSLPNKSVFTLSPLTADTCDMSGEDCVNRHWDMTGVSWQQALDALTQANGLTPATNEETSTAAVSPTAQPVAVSQRWPEPSKTWWTGQRPIGSPSASLAEARKRDQTGRKRVSPMDMPEDPLGADRAETRPNKNSEGRRASPIRHNWEGGSPLALSEGSGSNAGGSISEGETSQTLTYLADMLPVDSATIDGNQVTLAIGSAEIIVTAQATGNFSVQSFVAGEPVQETENIPAGDLIKWAFTICEKVRELAAQWEDGSHKEKSEDYPGNDHIPPSDVYEVLAELARETGKPTDIIRNKSLVDLRQGLIVAKPPFDQRSGRRFFGDDFDSGRTPDAEASGSHGSHSLKGSTMHDGHPVSLNENRDASQPYADTTGGKVLRWVPGEGCVFVDKSQVPPHKKLSWDAEHGVILADDNAPPPDRRNMWKHHWQP